MPDKLWLIATVAVFAYATLQVLRSLLTDVINKAVDRAINEVVRRATSTDDERLYEATRQIVCDGIRRAIKAERDDSEIQRLLLR